MIRLLLGQSICPIREVGRGARGNRWSATVKADVDGSPVKERQPPVEVARTIATRAGLERSPRTCQRAECGAAWIIGEEIVRVIHTEIDRALSLRGPLILRREASQRGWAEE
jgi:hypothetical protein